MSRADGTAKRLLDVLLVDDDRSDIALFLTAVKQSALNVLTRPVESVQTAIAYLEDNSPNRSRQQFPDIVVLDWSMPGKSGADFLRWRKRQPLLAKLPVLILSGVVDPRAAAQAIELGAIGYLAKPAGFEEWVELVRQVWDLGVQRSSQTELPKPDIRREL